MGLLQRLTFRRRMQNENDMRVACEAGSASLTAASRDVAGYMAFRRRPVLAFIVLSLFIADISAAQLANPRFSAVSKVDRSSRVNRVSYEQPNPTSIPEHQPQPQAEPPVAEDSGNRARQAILHSSAGGHPVGQIPEGFRRRRARLVADFQSSPLEPSPITSEMPLPDNNMSQPGETPVDGMQPHLGTRDWSEVDQWTEPGSEGTYYDQGDSMGQPYEVVDGFEGGMGGGEMMSEGYYDDCGACGTCDSSNCREYMTQGHFSLFGGVQGFKGGGNLGQDGSFGFHEGVNIGLPIPLFPGTGLGCQVGFRALQSNLSSSSLTFEQRNQTFFTTGIFRRVPCGLQGGIVFDLMKDEWYDDLNLGQVRGEIGWKLPCQHEWGYYFAAGDSGDSTASPLINGRIDRWTPVDFHSLYYRRRLSWCPGGTARFYSGFSSDQDGLIGAESYMPFNRRWALNTSFAYLIPDEASSDSGNADESWNLSIGLVWSWNGHCEYQYRPLFDVADNGAFFFRPEE